MRQKSTKENAPKRGRTYGSPPLGIPHSRGDGLRERNPPHWRTAPARLGQNRSTAPLLKYGFVPGYTLSGGFAKPFFHWQSTRAARRITWQLSLTFFALISLHERRSRNMMARAVRRELSHPSNFIPTVKRSPETLPREPFVPQTLPPGRTEGRRGGASMVSLPRKELQYTARRV